MTGNPNNAWNVNFNNGDVNNNKTNDNYARAVRSGRWSTLTCRVSEALQLHAELIDFAAQAITFESLKKRKRGVYRAVPVPPAVLEMLAMVHGLKD